MTCTVLTLAWGLFLLVLLAGAGAVLAAAAVLRWVLAPRLTAAKGEALAVTLCGWYAFAGAVLLFQHYFVGPVYTIYK